MTAFVSIETPLRSSLAPRDAAGGVGRFAENAVGLLAKNENVATPLTTFEPVMDPNAFVAFGVIAVLSAAAVYVWANEVVPVSRTKLALSKKNGVVKAYLDELRLETSGTTNLTKDFNSTSYEVPTKENIPAGRAFERWLFSDWLERQAGKSGRQKEPALPILKEAKWNSGDNPVLAASALIGLCVIISSVLERFTSLLQ